MSASQKHINSVFNPQNAIAFSFTINQLNVKAKYGYLSAFVDWGLTSKAHKTVSNILISSLANKRKTL